ncbi:unnamed protein product [Lactuca virosa]|uniref:RRM domain-containing protein n=1 Tax=Lactuca virosa TaxID=75947 RepID=A0AAU9PTJ4_9ASTR|nr:unnamed protein product [Lactuca virosa]
MEDGWTEVRNRKKPVNRQNDSDITGYFVSNIPNGATKEEFRRIFKTFGTLNDKLEINIARHERTEKSLPPSVVRRWSRTHVPIPVNVRGGFTGDRSYAEAVRGGEKVKILSKNLPPNLAPVRLVTNEKMV